MRELKVKLQENSSCSVPLDELDWQNWWQDTTEGSCYLHVRRVHDNEVTGWRVHCKASDTPRLMLKDGELYWLVKD